MIILGSKFLKDLKKFTIYMEKNMYDQLRHDQVIHGEFGLNTTIRRILKGYLDDKN